MKNAIHSTSSAPHKSQPLSSSFSTIHHLATKTPQHQPPTMACHSCLPTSIYNFNTTGMSGLVCGISAPPAVKNISSCCSTGHWMVKSNCTQYCEVHDQADFNLCINRDRGSAGNASSGSRNSSSSTIGFYDTLCKDANSNASGANACGVGGVEGEFSFSSEIAVW
jgi:hypothetical protein